ncbi:hypothetical protein DHD05_14470 [Arenibacter sp. N53]|nr:hypothetical protein [Arenibacter sp. N53]
MDNPCRIRSRPNRKNQTNYHDLTPYLQGFKNLAGLETKSGRADIQEYLQGFENLAGLRTGHKKAKRPKNPK